MLPFLSDRIFRIGAAVVILGSAPLLTIFFLSKIGLWPDPNPNPIGPGLLVFVTFWPGVILMAAGFSARRFVGLAGQGAKYRSGSTASF
jgi:hypothetical protein